MSDAPRATKRSESIADTIDSALNGVLEFLGRVFTTLWIVGSRVIQGEATRRTREPSRLVAPLTLLLLCALPYVLLQWAVVDVWYDRHAAELARPFVQSLASSIKLGASIPTTIVLTLPIVAVVIAARSLLPRLLRVERAKIPVVQASIADGFSLQFLLAALTHVLCFGAAVLVSVAPYLWPTGLVGEPAAVDSRLPNWVPFVWVGGALISGLVAPASVLTTLRATSSTLKASETCFRAISALLVCGTASFLSLYVVYIAQLIYKGTDLLDRRAVESTCSRVVVRVVDNVLTLRPVAAAPAATASAAHSVELTLLVSNGSTRTLIFSRQLGRLTFSDAKIELTALYLQPAESTVIPPGAVSAIPAGATLKPSAASGLADIAPKLQTAEIEYQFSFVGQTEEFRYHGERPSSHCKASFRAATWVLRSAGAAIHD